MLISIYDNVKDLEKKTLREKDIDTINTIGGKILNESINRQRQREDKLYSVLGLNIPLKMEKKHIEEIKNAIYGINETEDKVEITIDKCMEILVNYFNNLLSDYEENSNSSLQKNIKKIVEEFEQMKQNGEEYLNQRFNSINGLNNSFSASGVFNALSKFSDTVFTKMKITGGEKDQILKGTIDSNRASEILKKYLDMKNDIIGAIGESMGVYYRNLGKGKILAAFSTSGWDVEGKGAKRKVIARGSEENLQLLNDEELKQQFHDENNKALKELMQKVKNAEYESKNFKLKIGGEVKADTVYVIMSPEINRELFYFGVSNKTSYSESDILKIQTTSLSAIINNLYKIGNLAETGELSLSLKRILINTVLDQWNSYSFEDFQDLLNFIVDCYGDVWFTGGLEDKSRADFFSAYTMGKLYFIPMSYILDKIQENISKGEHFFGKIAINKYMIQDKELKEKIEQIEKKSSKTKEDKLEEEELKFSKGFLDTIKNYGGLYINKQSDRFANFYEIITEDIVKKVSKPDARITIKHGIIFENL